MENRIIAPITIRQNSISAPVANADPVQVLAPIELAADAYQLALREGGVGTRAQWLASLEGPVGLQGVQGSQGVQGPPGAAGGSWVHQQLAAAALWVITHSLGKHPSVTVVDSAGTVVHGNVHYDSLTQITLTFSAAFAGNAYLN